jgi:hypothetical protein
MCCHIINWTVGGSIDIYVSVKTLYLPNYKITSEIGNFCHASNARHLSH